MEASSKAKCDGSLDQTGGSGIRNNVIFGDSQVGIQTDRQINAEITDKNIYGGIRNEVC